MFVRASSGRRRFVPVHVGIDSESITRRPLTLRDVCTPRAVALPKDNLARRRGRGVFFSLVSLPRYDANARGHLKIYIYIYVLFDDVVCNEFENICHRYRRLRQTVRVLSISDSLSGPGPFREHRSKTKLSWTKVDITVKSRKSFSVLNN